MMDNRLEAAVRRPDERELRRTISALSGVFDVLGWMELDAIDRCIPESVQVNARASLVLAGELLCKGLMDRI